MLQGKLEFAPQNRMTEHTCKLIIAVCITSMCLQVISGIDFISGTKSIFYNLMFNQLAKRVKNEERKLAIMISQNCHQNKIM